MAEDEQSEELETVADEGPKDDKAKFREALAKKAGNSGRNDGGPGSSSKVGSEHAAAKASRQFRRKSGG